MSKANKLGKNLKQLINCTGARVSHLAKEFDVSEPTLYRIINNKTRLPRAKLINKISRYFKITGEELLGYEEIDWGDIEGWENILISQRNNIQVCSWKLSNSNNLINNHGEKKIIVSSEMSISQESFALKIQDNNIKNIPENSIIICDPALNPKNNGYVLVLYDQTKNLTLVQYLYEPRYGIMLKSLNKNFKEIYPLRESDQIFATVIEIRIPVYYTQNKIILEKSQT